MSQTIKLKTSSTPASVPSTGDLILGELAVNTHDGKLYFKKNDGSESIKVIDPDKVAPVQSVYGRTGDVIANVNDYAAFYLQDLTSESISDLADVSTSLLQTGDYLSWNGSGFENKPFKDYVGMEVGVLTQFQADGVDDMLDGKTVGTTVDHEVGQVWSSGQSAWRVDSVSAPMTIADFTLLSHMYLGDTGVANGNPDNLTLLTTYNAVAVAAKKRTILPIGTTDISAEWKVIDGSYITAVSTTDSILTLTDSASKEQNVITNEQNVRSTANTGNSNIVIEGFVIDGNYTRITPPYTGVESTGGCGIGFAFVRNARVSNMRIYDCNKHGIDINAKLYNSSSTGDPESYQDGESRHILIEFCDVSGCGDDQITTHFCRDVTIAWCYTHDTGDFYSVGNSNGFEIDDGSSDVKIFGGFAINCSRGVQVKGHDYAPAASDIKIIGLTCENNGQNFVLLHAGFDEGTRSRSAFDVRITDCTSIVPRKKNAETRARRHLSIQSYDNVNITNFTCIGTYTLVPATDPSNTSDRGGDHAIVMFGGARNIQFTGLTIRGEVDYTTCIQLNNTCEDVTFFNTILYQCTGDGFVVESGTEGVRVNRVRARTNRTPTPEYVFRSVNSPTALNYSVEDVRYSGYSYAYRLATAQYVDPIKLDNLDNGNIMIRNLPTTDPSVTGQLWNDGGTIKIS
ncbi:pectin lyase fold/virulence factor [Vibrio phage 1.293.O._10N.261.52.E1]|nr:pectin lyase fold/virulence factor [Vibrio phage 1.293.O._10N.261.52.E1]